MNRWYKVVISFNFARAQAFVSLSIPTGKLIRFLLRLFSPSRLKKGFPLLFTLCCQGVSALCGVCYNILRKILSANDSFTRQTNIYRHLIVMIELQSEQLVGCEIWMCCLTVLAVVHRLFHRLLLTSYSGHPVYILLVLKKRLSF